MDPTSHSPACAYLICAEAFLSQGVEKLIRERHPECDKLSSEDVCRLCCAVVHAQRGDVISNVQTLVGRYNCMGDVCSSAYVNTEHEMLLNPADPKSLYTSCCEETLGTHGRSLVISQSVGRGHILLKESPYAAVTCGHCACAAGNVLSEHISLACAIHQSKDKNAEKHAQFLKSFYSGLTKDKCKSVNKEKSVDSRIGQYKHRPSMVLIDQLMDEATIVRNGSHMWSLTTQILMALVCAIRSVHQTHVEYGTCSTDSVRVDTINKMRLFDNTWNLMQVLSRLPHNTHAISCVVANKGSTSGSREVEQMRLGYAVFLHASSINHSCAPNASIRYSTLPLTGTTSNTTRTLHSTSESKPYASLRDTTHRNSSKPNNDASTATSSVGSSADPALEYLRRIQIEIVSTTSIAGHKHTVSNTNPTAPASSTSEVCVSYGPLQGAHNVLQRRQVLHTQYLFHCECCACVSDSALNDTKPTASTAPTTYRIDPLRLISEQGSQHSNPTAHNVAPMVQQAVRQVNELSRTENDTKHLHDSLSLLKQQLEQINPLFTSVLHHTKNNQNQHLLDTFISKKLLPLHEKIATLQTTYFPRDSQLSEKRTYDVKCECSLYKADPLYADFCAVFCNYLDIYAHILARQFNYQAACVHIYYAITLMISSGMYDSHDVVIGRERVKLAGLLLSMGNKQDGSVQVKCALEILQPVVSRDDPDVIEAQNMLAFCRT